jgi:hypothetical protein
MSPVDSGLDGKTPCQRVRSLPYIKSDLAFAIDRAYISVVERRWR